MARKSLARWIDEALVDKDKEAPISALSLVHMVGQQRQELHSIKIGATGNYEGKDLEALFRGKAETFSQDLGTIQMFALLAFYGKNQGEAIMPFSVTPAINPETAGLSTEAPTNEGRMQQAMRWADAGQMQVYRRQQAQDEMSIRMLEQQDRMLMRSQTLVEKLMADNMGYFEFVKNLLAERDTNHHTREMERLNYERSTGERQKLIGFAPALINTILGRDIFPQSTEDTALIETIAESVDEEMIGKLAALDLPPMLMGPLASRIMKAMAAKEKREAAKSKRLPGYSGPADEDIAGGGK